MITIPFKPARKLILSFAILSLIIALSTTLTFAQTDTKLPVPSGNPNQLFYLQRSPNTNTIVYELNIKNGVLDTISPVHIFWICYAEHGQKEELTSVQRKYAYGLATKYLGNDHYELRFLAMKKHVVELMKGPDNQFHVYDQINGQQAILTSMFLQIDGGSMFSPNITSVTASGIDRETGAKVFEKKKIK
jgi:hypothetical protein